MPKGPLPDDLVLLGTWCLADRIDLSGKDLAGVMVRHPWLDSERLESDYKKIRALYDCALANLGDQLNAHHHVGLSARGWEIALGPWLRIFLNCVYERHLLMEEAVRKHDIASILTIEYKFERASHTTSQFVRAVQNPYWNAMFAADVAANMFPGIRCTIVSLPDEEAHQETTNGERPRTLSNRLAEAGKALFMGLDEWISRHRRVLLHRTGMQWREEFKLMLRLGLIPHMFLPTLAERPASGDDAVRQTLSLGLGDSSEEKVMEQMFCFYLPRIFVEDFAAVGELIRRRYPKRAKLIVTGVAYYTDDCFKLYTAFATDSGSKYMILQHGGGFGTPKINDEEELLLKTADNFLTWGWSEKFAQGRAKTIPNASLWLSSLEDVAPNPAGVLLMPVSEWTLQTFRLFSAPLSFRQLDYLDDIVTFYRQLDPSVAEKFRLRYLPSTRGWRVVERLKAAGLGQAILSSPGRFVHDLKDARLAVVNTNSTTLLEALSLNFPTVAILDPEMSPVRADVQEAFDALERVGIAYRSPEAAARFVSGIFANPAAWWAAHDTQMVRKSFVSRFARRETTLAKHSIVSMISRLDHD